MNVYYGSVAQTVVGDEMDVSHLEMDGALIILKIGTGTADVEQQVTVDGESSGWMDVMYMNATGGPEDLDAAAGTAAYVCVGNVQKIRLNATNVSSGTAQMWIIAKRMR